MHPLISRATMTSALVALGLAALGVTPAGAGTPSAPPARPGPDSAHRVAETERNTTTLLAGEALVADTSRSELRNGEFTLTVSSGHVELDHTVLVPGAEGQSSSSTGTWFRADPTGRFESSHDRTKLRLRRNGDLALITSRGRQLWHSGTQGKGVVRLTLHRNGALTLRKSSGKVVWHSKSGRVLMSGGMRLEPGKRLRGAWETAFRNGKPTTLTMQRDGNLVHRCGSRITWQTRTHVPGSSLRMSRKAVLRVVTPKGRVVWRSPSRGRGHDYGWFNSTHMTLYADGIDHVWDAPMKTEGC